MRKLIFAINVTLDGCCDHTKSSGSEEMLQHYKHLLQEVDLLVYGRKTYQLMVPYWPDAAKDPSSSTAEKEFARTFDSIRKVVFSRSLASAEDSNTRITHANLRDEILKLKQEPGKSILTGGVSLPSQLVELGLVDEVRVVVGPVVVGKGRRLFEDVTLQDKLQLKLVDSKILKSGCVALRYSK